VKRKSQAKKVILVTLKHGFFSLPENLAITLMQSLDKLRVASKYNEVMG
jgi:hypothetical protein